MKDINCVKKSLLAFNGTLDDMEEMMIVDEVSLKRNAHSVPTVEVSKASATNLFALLIHIPLICQEEVIFLWKM